MAAGWDVALAGTSLVPAFGWGLAFTDVPRAPPGARPGTAGRAGRPSGSGKTLAVYTLLRFADLAAGTLTVDGTDARDLPPERVRALLAWSPEQPVLFPASLRANLRLAALGASTGMPSTPRVMRTPASTASAATRAVATPPAHSRPAFT